MRRLAILSTKVTIEKSKNTLKLEDETITEKLKMLDNNLVFVPIDKASGNDDLFCQRHDAQFLINNLV